VLSIFHPLNRLFHGSGYSFTIIREFAMSTYSISQTAGVLKTRTTRSGKSANIVLWSLQGLLALLFMFAGVAKLMMPIQTLASQSGLPGLFMQFIAVAEVCGALGLFLPRILRLRPGLIPLAATGLVIIMIGATILTATRQGIAPALFPAIVGSLLSLIIRGRWQRTLRPYTQNPGKTL
jgi:hypothetical protein